MEKNTKDQSLLGEFLQNLENIPTNILDALLKITEDEDEKNVINSFAPSFTNQFREISLFASEKATTASRQGIAEAERFLKVSSGNLLADNMKIALPSIGSVIGKLGIIGIVQEIKKILRKLFELLKKTLPPWLDAVFLLIDEILNDLFGNGSPKLMTAFSEKEQNFLREQTELANLERASQFKYHQEEDED